MLLCVVVFVAFPAVESARLSFGLSWIFALSIHVAPPPIIEPDRKAALREQIVKLAHRHWRATAPG